MSQPTQQDQRTFRFVLTKDDFKRAAGAYFRVISDGRIYLRLLLIAVQFFLLLAAVWIAKASGSEAVFLWILVTYAALNVGLLVTGAYWFAMRTLKGYLARDWAGPVRESASHVTCTMDEKGIAFHSAEIGETRLPWSAVMEIETNDGAVYIRTKPLLVIPQNAFGASAEGAEAMKRHIIANVQMAHAKEGLLKENVR